MYECISKVRRETKVIKMRQICAGVDWNGKRLTRVCSHIHICLCVFLFIYVYIYIEVCGCFCAPRKLANQFADGKWKRKLKKIIGCEQARGKKERYRSWVLIRNGSWAKNNIYIHMYTFSICFFLQLLQQSGLAKPYSYLP